MNNIINTNIEVNTNIEAIVNIEINNDINAIVNIELNNNIDIKVNITLEPYIKYTLDNLDELKKNILFLKEKNINILTDLLDRQTNIKSLFIKITIKLFSGYLNQITYINLLNILVNTKGYTKFKITDINLKNIINTMKINKLLLCYKVLVLLVVKNDIRSKIINIINDAKGLNKKCYGNVYNLLSKINTVDEYLNLQYEINIIKKYIATYNKISLKNKIPQSDSDILSDKKVLTDQEIEILWINSNKYEIIDRLISLVEYIGLKLCYNLKINIITVDDALNMRYNELVVYYNLLVQTVANYIKKINGLIYIYIDIEEQYQYILEYSDDKINIKNFEYIAQTII
jgi:hypothetical protein